MVRVAQRKAWELQSNMNAGRLSCLAGNLMWLPVGVEVIQPCCDAFVVLMNLCSCPFLAIIWTQTTTRRRLNTLSIYILLFYKCFHKRTLRGPPLHIECPEPPLVFQRMFQHVEQDLLQHTQQVAYIECSTIRRQQRRCTVLTPQDQPS